MVFNEERSNFLRWHSSENIDNNVGFKQIVVTLYLLMLPERIDCKITPTFGSGEDVLRYVQDHTIKILFLDIDMPKINGFILASELKKKSPDTIIIFISAYEDFVYSSFEYAPFRFLRKSHLEDTIYV